MRQRQVRLVAVVLLGVASGLFAVVGCQARKSPSKKSSGLDEAIRGDADARQDIASNKLTLKTLGYPAVPDHIYAEVLKERFEAKYERVAGCMVDSGLLEHTRAYDRVMEEEIARRFGADALMRAEREAEKRYDALRKQAAPPPAEQVVGDGH